jgi:hypothetical protein
MRLFWVNSLIFIVFIFALVIVISSGHILDFTRVVHDGPCMMALGFEPLGKH